MRICTWNIQLGLRLGAVVDAVRRLGAPYTLLAIGGQIGLFIDRIRVAAERERLLESEAAPEVEAATGGGWRAPGGFEESAFVTSSGASVVFVISFPRSFSMTEARPKTPLPAVVSRVGLGELARVVGRVGGTRRRELSWDSGCCGARVDGWGVRRGGGGLG